MEFENFFVHFCFHVFILLFSLMVFVHLSLDGSFVARVDLPFKRLDYYLWL
jgi:hypothetical protein